MNKMFCLLLILYFLICFSSLAVADSLNLSLIQNRETFYYDNENNTSWTYHQTIEKMLDDGAYIEILAVDWGNSTEITSYPEIRFFVKSKDQTDVLVQGLTIFVNGNIFDLTLDELDLENIYGSFCYLTNESISLLKSFTIADSFFAFLRHADGIINVSFTYDEMAPIRQFSNDLLNLNFLENISSSEKKYEKWCNEQTPIISFVNNDVLQNEYSAATKSSMQNTKKDEWVKYTLSDLGIEFYLPSYFTTYTRGMSTTDPAIISSGMLPSQVDQILEAENSYLEASSDNFRSEIIVTMIGSTLSDFSNLDDNVLLTMSSMWIDAFKNYGITVLDIDIFSHNGVKYIRMHELQKNADGSSSYRIQYYTTVNKQAINFVFLSAEDEITDTERAFMQTVVEHVIFSSDIFSANTASFAQDEKNFLYTLKADGSICITGYSGFKSSITIPSSINNKPVTSLAVMERNAFVTNVFLPESISVIDNNPFANWNALKSITVSIDNPYFTSENGILLSKDKQILISYPSSNPSESFTTPSYVKIIGKDSFHGALYLKQLILSTGITTIGDNAFFGLDNITSIIIPNTVTKIGINPFSGMYNLKEISLAPDNKVFVVQQGVLYNVESDTLIAIPRNLLTSRLSLREGIISIGDYAFWYNESDCYIQFPNTLKYIGESAFCGCEKMSFSDFPEGLLVIESDAFMSTSIKSVVIPSSVKKLGRACFAACDLVDVTIMPGVTEVAATMFNDCDIRTIRLPDTIISIGEMAFVNCNELREIYIPSSVIEMGDDVFKKCPNVTVFIVKDSYAETYCKENNISYKYYF